MTYVNVAIRIDTLEALWATRTRDDDRISDLIQRALKPTPIAGFDAPQLMAPAKAASGKFKYELLSERRSAASASDALVDILKSVSELDATFLDRLAPQIKGRSRNHIARERSDVYPGRPHLLRSVRQVIPGWFVGTNIANRDKRQILRIACRITGLKFGSDIIFDP